MSTLTPAQLTERHRIYKARWRAKQPAKPRKQPDPPTVRLVDPDDFGNPLSDCRVGP